MQHFCKGGGGGGVNLGYLKRGGRSCKQRQGSTGRQCSKISLIILRGGGANAPCPPKYTPELRTELAYDKLHPK